MKLQPVFSPINPIRKENLVWLESTKLLKNFSVGEKQ